MASILKEVEQVLRDRLSGFVSGLEEDRQTGRILGFVISSDFDDLDHRERQQKLRDALRSGLTSEQTARIGPVVTMTPLEADIDELAEQSGA